MEHAHHLWLEQVGRDLQTEYEQIQDSLKSSPSNIQQSGHQAEAAWVQMLSAWLPPQYQVGTRKHLLLEQEVDGRTRSNEVDLVVFHPSYPIGLRSKADVMIAGVVAAFSVKLTLRRAGLREAIEEASVLRRGIKPRSGALIGDLVSPLIVGVLAQSAVFGKSATAHIDRLLEDGFKQASHPREELDLVCIADLNCWHLYRGIVAKIRDEYERVWLQGWGEARPMASPVASLVSELWSKLANRDQTLRPIAHGFQYTDTSGPYVGSANPSEELDMLVSEGTRVPSLRANETFQID